MLDLCPCTLALDLAKGAVMDNGTLENATQTEAAQCRNALLNVRGLSLGEVTAHRV